MPYCLKCRDEFQDWVKVCPDCNVALVDKLPPTPPKVKRQDEPLVHIATASSEPIAKMWAELLEKNGIKCILESMNVTPYYVAIWPYDVYVRVSDEDRAEKILAPFLRGIGSGGIGLQEPKGVR